MLTQLTECDFRLVNRRQCDQLDCECDCDQPSENRDWE